MSIHPTAIVDKGAFLDSSVEVGPYAIIEPKVKIAKGVKIHAHAYICKNTEIDENTEVHIGAILGNVPQDLSFQDKDTFLKIGKRNVIREYVTIHRGTKEGSSTIIGDENFLMATVHIAHNCHIGNRVIIANASLLAGHIQVEDGAFISGGVSIHQHCRIGRLAIIGGFTGVNKDVPPYMAVRGPSVVWSINLVGLRRAKFSREAMHQVKEAYGNVYRSGLNTEQALAKIIETNPGPEVMHFVEFIKNSRRGICKYKFEGEDKDYFAGKDDEAEE